MNYRVAKLADARKIYQCGKPVLPVHYSTEDLEYLIPDSDYEIVIAETKKKYLVGFIIGHYIKNTLHITSLAVNKSHHRRGIGSNLINYIKKFGTTITLNVHVENISAIQMYKKNGFTIDETIQDFYLVLPNTTNLDAYKMSLVVKN